MHLFIILILLCAFAVIFFIVIARKGRALRTAKTSGPAVQHAFLEWVRDGAPMRTQVTAPFYLGRSSESDIALPDAKAPFEICIFYHDRRFAVQLLQGAGRLSVNGQEMLAGYLADGDHLEIAGQSFVFRCY